MCVLAILAIKLLLGISSVISIHTILLLHINTKCNISTVCLILRYAVQLLTPAKFVAQVNSRDIITSKDIEECAQLFLDAKTSAQILLQDSLLNADSVKRL